MQAARQLLASEAIIRLARNGHFAPNMSVSSRSVFSEDTWDMFEDEIPRLALYRGNQLRIVWRGPDSDAGHQLPSKVVTAVKTFAFESLRVRVLRHSPDSECGTGHGLSLRSDELSAEAALSLAILYCSRRS